MPSRRNWTLLVIRVVRVSGFLASVIQRTHSLRWLYGRASKAARAASSWRSAAARSAEFHVAPRVSAIAAVMAAAYASGASTGEK